MECDTPPRPPLHTTNQVSISGQALVFVTRTASHSFLDPAGALTYVAFFGAQARQGRAGAGASALFAPCGTHATP